MLRDVFSQAWQQILARPTGPLAFRFYLQPAMAALLAVLPYLLLRGAVTRIARRWIGPGAQRMRRAA